MVTDGVVMVRVVVAVVVAVVVVVVRVVVRNGGDGGVGVMVAAAAAR